MTLAELLQSKFRADIRFRGVAYVKAERVSITRVMENHVFGVVRDGTEYQTQLTREGDALRMHCNCASETQANVSCKHLWATILSVDEEGLLTSTPRPGHIPPFLTESAPLAFNDVLDDDDLGEELPTPRGMRSSAGLATAEPAPAAAPQLSPWEAELHKLRQQMDNQESPEKQASRERDIFYEVDIEHSNSARQLVIQTSQRQRRANGQWGKLKPLKLRPGKFESIDRHDDRRILAYLSGGTPERTNWYAQQNETQATVYRYHVPYELCELILPLICETGRLRFLNTSESNPEVLEWDGNSPWEFTLRVTFDTEQQHWSLCNELVREDELLAIADCRLLVPGGLVFANGRVACVRDFGAYDWISLGSSGAALEIPAGAENQLIDQLLDMPCLPRLVLPKELQLEEVECDPEPHLVISAPKSQRWNLERLQGQVQLDYLGTTISASSDQWAVVQREEGRCVLRNREFENQAWSQLQDCGFRRLLDQRRGGHDVEIAARDLGRAVRQLIQEGWQIRADGKRVRQAGGFQFRVQSGIDWFELHAHIDYEDTSVSFPELLSALSRGDTTIRLDDGSLGIVPEEWMQQFGLLAGLGSSEEDHLRFSAHQVTLLDALLQAETNTTYDDRFIELRDQMQSFEGISPSEKPQGFQGELRAYQQEGLGWLQFLSEFHFGGCLADDMGLGKTVQLLAVLQNHYRSRKNAKQPPPPSLIVVPKSLIFNWRRECEKFTPDLSILEYIGIDRGNLRQEFHKHQIIISTYGTVRRDILDLKDTQFDYLVLDEAQTIKNASSQIAKASRLLRANHRVALSGTPIENHLGDLWSIFEFLNPGMLGRSSAFRQFAADSQDRSAQQSLARGLRPFILRRTKQQVASELPEKLEETIFCDLGEEQSRLYEEMRQHYRQSLLGLVESQGLRKSKMHVLEALLRLRQAACHPGLLDDSKSEDRSAKLDFLCPRLAELVAEGHKALVFSQFTSMLSIVRSHLDAQGIQYEYLDGQTRDRESRVEHFQSNPDCGVFLISLKAGGLGLNLTAADYVFLLDPWWNPAVETQAIDRAHRVGQTRAVFAYRLICRNTVEEKIAEMQRSKRTLADAILEADGGSILQNLSSEDLEALLS